MMGLLRCLRGRASVLAFSSSTLPLIVRAVLTFLRIILLNACPGSAKCSQAPAFPFLGVIEVKNKSATMCMFPDLSK